MQAFGRETRESARSRGPVCLEDRKFVRVEEAKEARGKQQRQKKFAGKSDTSSENTGTALDGGTRYLHVLQVPASNVRFSGGRWEQNRGLGDGDFTRKGRTWGVGYSVAVSGVLGDSGKLGFPCDIAHRHLILDSATVSYLTLVSVL